MYCIFTIVEYNYNTTTIIIYNQERAFKVSCRKLYIPLKVLFCYKVKTMKEIWKDIPWYEWIYQASKTGKIKSVDRKIFHKDGSMYQNIKWRILREWFHKRIGYNHLVLCSKGEMKTFRVHRLIAITFIENPEDKPQVNHINWIKTDNIVENLEWCTASENTIHGFKTWLISSNLIGLNTWKTRKEKKRTKKDKYIL